MSRLFSNSGIPLITYRITIKTITQEQIRAEREEADRAFLEDREVLVDPDIAYESDIEIRLSHIASFIDRLQDLEHEYYFLNA